MFLGKRSIPMINRLLLPCASALAIASADGANTVAETSASWPPGARISRPCSNVSEWDTASYTSVMGLAVIFVMDACSSAVERLRSRRCDAPRLVRYVVCVREAVVMMGENPEMRPSWMTGWTRLSRGMNLQLCEFKTYQAGQRMSRPLALQGVFLHICPFRQGTLAQSIQTRGAGHCIVLPKHTWPQLAGQRPRHTIQSLESGLRQ